MSVAGRLLKIWTVCMFVHAGTLGQVEAAAVEGVADLNSSVTQAEQRPAISDLTVFTARAGPLVDANTEAAGALNSRSAWNDIAVADASPKDVPSDGKVMAPSRIREIQQLLLQLGFDPGPIDGKLGPSTARAISSYQETEGLTVDGRPSRELLRQLREDAANLMASPPPSKPDEIADLPGSESPTSSGEIDSQYPQDVPLAGTTWRFTDESGSEFSLKFIQGGAVEGVLYEKFWKWRQSGEEIEILYDNGLGLAVFRKGTMSMAGIMEGTAVPSRGDGWAWKAERTFPPVTGSEKIDALPSAETERPAGLAHPTTPAMPTDIKPEPLDDDQEIEATADSQESIPPDDNETSVPPDAQSPTETGEYEPMTSSGSKESVAAEPKTPRVEPRPSISVQSPTAIPPGDEKRPLVSKKEASGDDTETAARRPQAYGSQSDETRIVIRALSESWIDVTNREGEILFSRVLNKGDSYRAPLIEGATMVTGNAGGIEISVDGEPALSFGEDEGVRRDIKLDPDLLKAGAMLPQAPPVAPGDHEGELEGEAETEGREPRVYGSENDDSRIIIRAVRQSWVEVTSGKGDILFSRVLRKGDSYRVPLGESAKMVTGNAGGIEIVVDGERTPFSGPEGVVRRDIKLDPDLLKSGDAWQPAAGQR